MNIKGFCVKILMATGILLSASAMASFKELPEPDLSMPLGAIDMGQSLDLTYHECLSENVGLAAKLYKGNRLVPLEGDRLVGIPVNDSDEINDLINSSVAVTVEPGVRILVPYVMGSNESNRLYIHRLEINELYPVKVMGIYKFIDLSLCVRLGSAERP